MSQQKWHIIRKLNVTTKLNITTEVQRHLKCGMLLYMRSVTADSEHHHEVVLNFEMNRHYNEEIHHNQERHLNVDSR